MRRTGGVTLVLLALASTARADVEFKFGGQISSDIRYRLGGEEVPPGTAVAPFPSQQKLLKYGFSRNENLIKAQLTITVGERVKAVADVDFVWYGYSDVRDIDSLTLHERVDPFRLEAHAAYIDIYKILPRLDLRIGRQVVAWGTGDKFNPTSNLNTLDLSDPLLFGRAIANEMIRLDYNPWRDLIITAVWVPIFRPAQLPRTAPLAVTDLQRPAPVQEDGIRLGLQQLANLYPPTQIQVQTMQPEPSIQNSQFGIRVAGRLPQKMGGQDVSVSYYHGRFGVPSPAWTINGNNGLVTAYVMWPRMDVLGGDIAGSIEKLGGLGYWAEGAVYFPQEITYGVYNDNSVTSVSGHDPITFRPTPLNPDGSSGPWQVVQSYPEARRGTVVPSTPFWKLTLGVDYSWNKYLYSNLQYVHGFIDEFGAGTNTYSDTAGNWRSEQRLGEYLIVGSDLKLFSDQLLLRFFGAFKMPVVGDQNPKFTAVLFPQVAWAVWDATELSIGAFVFLGDRDTKFGDPAAGASEIFAKAKFTY
jgi:hypothetical protein